VPVRCVDKTRSAIYLCGLASVTLTIGIEPGLSGAIAMNENQQTHAAELERQQLIKQCHVLIAAIASRGATKLLGIMQRAVYAAYKQNRRRFRVRCVPLAAVKGDQELTQAHRFKQPELRFTLESSRIGMDFRRCQRAMAAIRDRTQAVSEKTIQEACSALRQLIEVYRRTLTEQWVGPEFCCESGMSISARSITDRYFGW